MVTRALFDLIHRHGDALLALLVALQEGADELFASPNTLHAVEDHLLAIARTLAHLPPVLLLRLPLVDWAAWQALYQALQTDDPGRRELVWYACRALLPATLVLLDELRRREPVWFEIQY